MSEQRIKVRHYEIIQRCEKIGCGGEYTYMNESIEIEPPDPYTNYKHKCICGEIRWFRKIYPHLEIKRLN